MRGPQSSQVGDEDEQARDSRGTRNRKETHH
jgi:hypothetical protein